MIHKTIKGLLPIPLIERWIAFLLGLELSIFQIILKFPGAFFQDGGLLF